MRPLLLLLTLAAPAAPLDVLAWPGMTTAALVCVLHKELGATDARFRCGSKPPPGTGDVCVDPVKFREGPQLPDAHAARLHPRVKQVRLAWEGGRLQSLDIELNEQLPPEEVRRIFRLPERFIRPQPNVLDITIRPCGEVTCLMLQGFPAADTRCVSAPPPGAH